jgi:D-alanyl-D-alanine carboxypeptidase
MAIYLAPPGHFHHGISDFEIGKIGYGAKNFIAGCSRTAEYQKIARLGNCDSRDPAENLFGVRFEPQHIKIAH